MGIERFYLDSEFQLGDIAILEGTEQHHAARVIRLEEGDTLELVNGKGSLAEGEVISVSKDKMQLKILQVSHVQHPSKRMDVAIPLMRPSKLEWVFEKGTELGADSFLLYSADYSEKDNLSSHQLERLRAITISAMKQSGRLYLPSIELLPDLSMVMEREALFFFGDTSLSPPYFRSPESPLVVFITGPERGFSPKEKEILMRKARSSSLSPNILRAETAPLAALTLFFAS